MAEPNEGDKALVVAIHCGWSPAQYADSKLVAAYRAEIEAATRTEVEQEIVAYLGKVADTHEFEYVGGECCADALRIEAGNISDGEYRRGT